MASRHVFTVPILDAGRGGAYVEVPFDVRAAFGEGRPAVKATIEGETFRTRLMKMGGECHIVGVPKEIRVRASKGIGDSIRVVVEPDTEPRVVEVPEDLARLLARDKAAKAFFDALSYTHRKEYVRWIAEAKRQDTRERRCSKAVEMLKAAQRGI